jgi:hypothetical protein
MKSNALLVILLFFSGKMVFGQTPNYLADGSKWRINSVGLSNTTPCWTEGKYVVEIVGDSVIGGLTYKHLIYHGVMSENPINPQPGVICNADYTFSNLYGFVRQAGKKLYSYDLMESVDTLLYDFDLQVGDTLPLTIINSDTAITVTAITNFQVGNETRSIFDLSTNLGVSEKLIEGIGHNKGFLGHMQPFEFAEVGLICYSRNDSTYYDNGVDVCDLNVGLNEFQSIIKVEIFPNPTSDFVTITSPQYAEIQSFEIVDLLGAKCAIMVDFSSNEKAVVNLESLVSGNYILQVHQRNGEVYRLKIVKE